MKGRREGGKKEERGRRGNEENEGDKEVRKDEVGSIVFPSRRKVSVLTPGTCKGDLIWR